MSWTPERTELLRRYWAEGLAGSAIGVLLGCTKNSVIGRVHRLRLPKRRQKITARPKDSRTSYAKRKPRPPRPKPVVPAQADTIEPTALFLTLMQLERGQCRYPLGDGPYLFCARPTDEVYCTYHRRVCYQPPKSRYRQPTFGLGGFWAPVL